MYLETHPSKRRATLLFAHGAGAPMDSPFMNRFAEMLTDHGIAVVRFEFPYMVRRRDEEIKRPPDKEGVLLERWRQAVRDFSDRRPLFIGGKSMGGRMASILGGEQLAVEGVVCLGYPFHPPGKPDRLRIAHWSDVKCPGLIVQGERDPFGTLTEVAGYSLPDSVKLHWIPHGNHDLAPLKRSGYTPDDSMRMAAVAVANFILAASEASASHQNNPQAG